MNKKFTKLEAIRGLAALYVVLYHSFSDNLFIFNINFSFLFKFGQEAVLIFFLLSGFVINYSFKKSANKTFGNYFIKRFLRIYIPLIFVFLTNYFIFSFYNHQLINIQLKSLVCNLLMLQDIPTAKLNVIAAPYLYNDPLWSLSYEWWFYMLFYFFITKFKTRSTKIVFAISILSAVTYFFHPFFLNRLLLYFAIWWTGVHISEMYFHKQPFNFRTMGIALYSLLICLFILTLNACFNRNNGLTGFIGHSPLLEVRHFGFAIITVFIAIGWNRVRWKYFDRVIGPFKLFAPISYVLYISHHFFVTDNRYLYFIGNYYLEFAVGLFICIAYSWLIELKFYVWIRNTVMRRATRVDVAIGSTVK